ncbi:hypothetical protein [Lysinibacillus sp. TE18511]
MEDLAIIYRDKAILQYTRDKISEVSSIITNTALLEHNIFSQLMKYYSARKTHSIRRSKLLVDREIAKAKKEYGCQQATIFSNMSVTNDFGESLEFEPEDLLARGGETAVQNISLNEEIARLATDDRELATLNAWANGFNDTQVSTTLASHFGGNKESHRKFVRRFKVKCQERLEKECLAKNLLIKTS